MFNSYKPLAGYSPAESFEKGKPEQVQLSYESLSQRIKKLLIKRVEIMSKIDSAIEKRRIARCFYQDGQEALKQHDDETIKNMQETHLRSEQGCDRFIKELREQDHFLSSYMNQLTSLLQEVNRRDKMNLEISRISPQQPKL